MSNLKLARSAIERGKRWLQAGSRAFEDKRWDDVVYSSQMAVEHFVKSVLIAFGIDFPRVHDVSDILEDVGRRSDVPAWFREMVPEIAKVMSELAELRGIAGYGFEEGVDCSYFRDYAPEALKKARMTLEACLKLIKELFKTET
ncbi:HEPN domain-containing protein [Candidatus Bathyarchaeota archaeon]|nr:HEPN domain-containing protein [Candidatus Bathyarchaeota archaeon]